MAKILVFGGTGAFGVYLIDELLSKGHTVDVVSLDEMLSSNERLHYIKANAKDMGFLKECLAKQYDGIVDFMLYFTSEFKERYELFLQNTAHYIYLSTYRIYADCQTPITENSPRLMEVITDPIYQNEAEREYSLYKAKGEDMLRSSGYTNWTILRPSISYSKRRFQLVTLEANTLIHRMRQGRTVVLPEEAMNKQTTMTWAGDSAKMMAALLFNEKAYGETYTIATAEHHTWKEVAEIYRELCGLKYVTTDNASFLYIWSPASCYGRYQLFYDRLFQRVIDNTKVLTDTGLRQSQMMPLYEGLKRELAALPSDYSVGSDNTETDIRMDAFLHSIGIER